MKTKTFGWNHSNKNRKIHPKLSKEREKMRCVKEWRMWQKKGKPILIQANAHSERYVCVVCRWAKWQVSFWKVVRFFEGMLQHLFDHARRAVWPNSPQNFYYYSELFFLPWLSITVSVAAAAVIIIINIIIFCSAVRCRSHVAVFFCIGIFAWLYFFALRCLFGLLLVVVVTVLPLLTQLLSWTEQQQ